MVSVYGVLMHGVQCIDNLSCISIVHEYSA
jgi:hypothetical protein